MSKQPVKQQSSEPGPSNVEKDGNEDPIPDIKFNLSTGEYYLGFLHEIQVKAPIDPAMAATPYFKPSDSKEEEEEIKVYKPKKKHLIIELIVFSRYTLKEESFFVWMRRSSYYIVGFRAFGKTYHFCDFVDDNIGGTTLEYKSDYGDLSLRSGGLDTVKLGFNDFCECVVQLIYDITVAPADTTRETPQITVTPPDTKQKKKKPKSVDKNTKTKAKAKADKPPIDHRNPDNDHQFSWQPLIVGILVYVGEAVRNVLFARIIHLTQVSPIAITDYTVTARSGSEIDQLKTNYEKTQFRKSVTQSLQKVEGKKLDPYQSILVINWHNTSETAHLYVLEEDKPLYLTSDEEETLQGPIVYDEIENGKIHFNNFVKPNKKLCYYCMTLRCNFKGDAHKGTN